MLNILFSFSLAWQSLDRRSPSFHPVSRHPHQREIVLFTLDDVSIGNSVSSFSQIPPVSTLGGHTWFTILDQGKAYTEGNLAEGSHHRTSFTTPWGLWVTTPPLLSAWRTCLTVCRTKVVFHIILSKLKNLSYTYCMYYFPELPLA